MKIILDENQVYEILDEWCKREHGNRISVLQWQIDYEEHCKFLGVLIKT